jgi:hypothetical protein
MQDMYETGRMLKWQLPNVDASAAGMLPMQNLAGTPATGKADDAFFHFS